MVCVDVVFFKGLLVGYCGFCTVYYEPCRRLSQLHGHSYNRVVCFAMCMRLGALNGSICLSIVYFTSSEPSNFGNNSYFSKYEVPLDSSSFTACSDRSTIKT